MALQESLGRSPVDLVEARHADLLEVSAEVRQTRHAPAERELGKSLLGEPRTEPVQLGGQGALANLLVRDRTTKQLLPHHDDLLSSPKGL